ncbi:YbaB/EbfC family nucleoid-associated protein [Nonomuraea sp. NPDC005983]|uniref:YbaB/EbfC family nucleoid-associated protein n=1 Tax=Nonomuraea sp. NPDC005983 TaxID=3155595 RepID=UPI0033A12258
MSPNPPPNADHELVERTLREAQEAMRRLQEAQEAALRVTGSGESADGLVKAASDGRGGITGISLNPRAERAAPPREHVTG